MRLIDSCVAVIAALIAQESVGDWLGWLVLLLSIIAFVLSGILAELRRSNDLFKLKGDKQ